ncbi:hypothetical protein PISMIDRAFT_690472, partial [Pisolithus microcarpus 441]
MVDPHRRGFGVPSARNARTLALSPSLHRFPHLASIADSFPYVVSRMGTTESSVKGTTPVPLAVGFWVATRLHFDTVVVGSRIVSLMPDRSCSASGREGLKESSSSDSSTAGIQSSQYHYPVIAGISRPTGMTSTTLWP